MQHVKCVFTNEHKKSTAFVKPKTLWTNKGLLQMNKQQNNFSEE